MALCKTENCKKFIWRIENYNCLKDYSHVSPCFSSNDVLWDLTVFPRGNTEKDFIAIHLKSLNPPRTMKVLKCSVSFLDSEGSPLIWKETSFHFSPVNWTYNDISASFEDFIAHKEVFGARKSSFFLLPYNILTIQCYIWEGSEELLSRTPEIALTHIVPRPAEVFTASFILNYDNVFSVENETQKHVRKKINIIDSLTLDGCWIDDKLITKIRLSHYHKYLAICSISVLDSVGKYFQYTTGTYHFNDNVHLWTFDTNITKSLLKCHKSKFLVGNRLSVKVTCMLSEDFTLCEVIDKPLTFGKDNSMVSFESVTSTDGSENMLLNTSHICNKAILQDLKGMYEEGFMSDFSFKVKDETFPVHKAILGVRSPVFRSMFTTEMKEKQDNCVEIEDVDADTLRRMLQYFYSDNIDGDMGWESAYSLYVAADKYNVKTLKHICSYVLKSRLCIEGALSTLALANLYEDQDLKSATLDFISWKDKEIVGTERWARFEEENAQMAHDTLKKLYIKKMG